MTLRPAQRLRGLERSLIRRFFDSAPRGAINLGLGEPDLETPAELSLAGVAAIAEGRTGYTSTAGDLELRRAVAARYAGRVENEEGVLITAGSQEALVLGCLTLVDAQREVLVPDPGYPAYPTVARLLGARPVPYPLRAAAGFRLVAEDVERRLSSQTGLVILAAPSNPTGACHPARELERLVATLERRGIPWISDEVYASLVYAPPYLSPADLVPQGGLVIAGLSKELRMTGWRLGWLLGPAEIVARAAVAHQHLVICAPSISQRAALAAFGAAGGARRASWLERLRQRRRLMAGELERIPRIRFVRPDGAFYYFVDVSAHGDELEIARRLVETRGVITIPGRAFGSGGQGHLRLSFAAHEDDIVRGVRRIGRELGG